MAYTGPPPAFEQTLRDQGYVPLPDFAVIDECDFFDHKTRQKVHLDKARLEKLAGEQNRRVARSDATPIIVGHTKDDVAETEQPGIVGYATNFRVGQLPDGKSAIFARPWAKKGEVETFRKHPRRSVELWLDPDAIDPIALLGQRPRGATWACTCSSGRIPARWSTSVARPRVANRSYSR
jgi:hypothetical protein